MEGFPITRHESTMNTDRKWIIVRIDGKIAAVSTDYRMLASITARLAEKGGLHQEINATACSFDEVWKLRQEAEWEDMMLFGTDFQKKVWRILWDLVHKEDGDSKDNNISDSPDGKARLLSYSDFAELCNNRAGVRAVAHAVGLNPVSVMIPCHLIVPKETIDKIAAIQKKAEATIFKGDDLCLTSILADPATDFGEYALGRDLKKELILREFDTLLH